MGQAMESPGTGAEGGRNRRQRRGRKDAILKNATKNILLILFVKQVMIFIIFKILENGMKRITMKLKEKECVWTRIF